MKPALIPALLVLLLTASAACAQDDDEARIRRITINVFPNNVIIVKGKMVELDALKDHLKDMVPDAQKPTVDVIVVPQTPAEMTLVAKVILVARDAGYTKVSYESAKPVKKKITELTLVVSRTGDISVGDDVVKKDKLVEHLQKLVEEDRRDKVRVYVRASRQVRFKEVGEVMNLVRQAGFKDVVFGVIAE